MSISLKQAYDLFIFDRETYCKEKTIQNYRNTLSYFFKFLEGDRGCSISEIMLDSITTHGFKEICCVSSVKEQTGISSVKTDSKSAYNEAVYSDVFRGSPDILPFLLSR